MIPKKTNNDTMAETDAINPSSSSLYCYCKHASCCSECGKPMPSKEETKSIVAALESDERPARSNVEGNGPLLLSNIPVSCGREDEVLVGIDEAG